MPIKDKEKYNAYMREYNNRTYALRCDKFRAQLGNKCTKCESTDSLNFSGTTPLGKSFDLSRRMTSAPMKDLQELFDNSNYTLLCNKCLAKQTKGVEHGGGISGVRNCKCDLCKAKKAEYMRSYMKKKRATID
jgi:hypothetical protein